MIAGVDETSNMEEPEREAFAKANPQVWGAKDHGRGTAGTLLVPTSSLPDR